MGMKKRAKPQNRSDTESIAESLRKEIDNLRDKLEEEHSVLMKCEERLEEYYDHIEGLLSKSRELLENVDNSKDDLSGLSSSIRKLSELIKIVRVGL